MLNDVGFNASIERIDRAEWARRQIKQGLTNSIMFFGPGGRVTALSGAYFAYAGHVGPLHDQDVQNALERASGASTLEEYMDAMTEIGKYGHDRAYSPGLLFGERDLVRAIGNCRLGPQPQPGTRTAQSPAARCRAAAVTEAIDEADTDRRSLRAAWLSLPSRLALASCRRHRRRPGRLRSTSCPPRQPVLRLAIVSGDESYSTHPAEARFQSTHYSRLHQMPLFGVDPLEEKIDPTYGIAESWEYLPGAKGMVVKIKDGLTFNNGTPITVDDVVFSLQLTGSKHADSQIAGTLAGIGVERQGHRRAHSADRFQEGIANI